MWPIPNRGPTATDHNPGWKRGIRIGSAKDGKVTAFIPDPLSPDADGKSPATSISEGVAADAAGNIYGAEVGPKRSRNTSRIRFSPPLAVRT